MATETGLTKVNVFSSKASYEANKASIGSDEISLIKSTGDDGSISSSDFSESTGYIKYNNGVLMCWGKGNWSTVTFPAAFSILPQVINVVDSTSGSDDDSDAERFYVQDLTLTSFKARSTTRWFAIGKWN